MTRIVPSLQLAKTEVFTLTLTLTLTFTLTLTLTLTFSAGDRDFFFAYSIPRAALISAANNKYLTLRSSTFSLKSLCTSNRTLFYLLRRTSFIVIANLFSLGLFGV